ncbi:hypothetical protein [Amycolatopsis thailandensis]|uniref:hypothetical protein n=1 Tax=Amycolatopsis thailandensis TaxID=589330 RepID=UPI00363CDC50
MNAGWAPPVLPWIGTLVTAVIDGYAVVGEVMDYQQARLSQSTFPVAFGPLWRTMTPATITELPEQPPGRREPERVGECATASFTLLDLVATTPDRPCDGNTIPAQRSTTNVPRPLAGACTGFEGNP